MTEPQTNQATPAKSPVPVRAKAPEEESFYVLDRTCQQGGQPRVHEMLNAAGTKTPYKFTYNEPLLVPYAHAMKFLESDFLVARDAEMTDVVRKSRSAKTGHDGHAVPPLNTDEVIASLDELKKEALLKRASTLPGGHGFNVGTKVETMVDFIVDYNRRTAEARSQVEIGDLDVGAAMPGVDAPSLADIQRTTERYRTQ